MAHPINEPSWNHCALCGTGVWAIHQVRTPVRARPKNSHISDANVLAIRQTLGNSELDTASEYNRYKVLCADRRWISSTFSHLPGWSHELLHGQPSVHGFILHRPSCQPGQR